MPEKPPKISDLLFLLTIPQIGPGRIRKLFHSFESVDEILRAPVQKLIQVEGIDYKLARQIKTGGDREAVEKQLELIEKHQINLLTIWDKKYPYLLKRISDPPVILFYRGKLTAFSDKTLAVVGTRTPSDYGRITTTRLVGQLVDQGVVIVSGMARGIDSIAHQTCLRNGGETIAVFGCGLNYCYPPENRELYQKIPRNGLLVSEFFLDVGPDAINFPKRNRIISGLSRGTLVIEAGDRSGALITAYYALNQNREVLAIPGNISSARSRGTNKLIKQGAKLVQSVDDIFEEIGEIRQRDVPAERPVPENLREWEKKILSNLSKEPKHIDKLVSELQESPGTILAGLLNLELLGLVQQLVGKMFVRL